MSGNISVSGFWLQAIVACDSFSKALAALSKHLIQYKLTLLLEGAENLTGYITTFHYAKNLTVLHICMCQLLF